MKAIKTFLIAAIVALAILPASALAPQYKAFYGFGDSVADSGNVFIATQQLQFDPAIPPAQTYFFGRFSNGPNAFDHLWNLLSGGTLGLQPFLASPNLTGKDAVSLAFGGSGSGFVNTSPGNFPVIGLKGQVALFAAGLGGRRPSSKALFGIITGANDYIGPQPLSPTEVVNNIAESIQFLYLLGARTLIVLNLPDLGKIPLTIGSPASAELTLLSNEHNALLAQKLNELAFLPGIKIIAVDVRQILGSLQTLPIPIDPIVPALAAKRGPAAAVCLFTNPATCPDATEFFSPDATANFIADFIDLPFVFWDAEHPTTGVHAALAQYLYAQLQ